jgi:hypothetical protein
MREKMEECKWLYSYSELADHVKPCSQWNALSYAEKHACNRVRTNVIQLYANHKDKEYLCIGVRL